MMTVAMLAALAACPPNRGQVASSQRCAIGTEDVGGVCYCPQGQIFNGQTCQGTYTPVGAGCLPGALQYGPPASLVCYCPFGTMQDTTGGCVAQQCTGGAVPGESQCECPTGSSWDGTQCATQQVAAPDPTPTVTCSGGAVLSGDQCACPDESSWDGSQCVVATAAPSGLNCQGGAVPNMSGDRCVCAQGSSWNGSACERGRLCKNALRAKHYDGMQVTNCDGVNDDCALAMLRKNYGIDQLPRCRNVVDSACAVSVIRSGGPLEGLLSCQGQ